MPGSARTAARRTRSTVLAALAVVGATLVSVLTWQSLAPSSPFGLSSSLLGLGANTVAGGDHKGALGEADGVVPDGVTVFDGDFPAVAKLDPDLLEAVRKAATDAADDGVEFYVNSGWRSAAYQDQLFREAISKYGSRREAARWVATSETSLHVSGDAVDIGRSDATTWLSEHGVKYGLCRIYRNEPWHYELRPEAVDHGCPSMYADPTHDPRMQS